MAIFYILNIGPKTIPKTADITISKMGEIFLFLSFFQRNEINIIIGKTIIPTILIEGTSPICSKPKSAESSIVSAVERIRATTQGCTPD